MSKIQDQQIQKKVMGVKATTQKFYAGPLPLPEDIQKYDSVYPGAAKIIFDMAQEHAAHQRKMEETSLKHQEMQIEHNRAALDEGVKIAKRNQIFAFLVFVGGLAFSAYLAIANKDPKGFGAFFAQLAAIAGLFIYTERKSKQK